MHAYDVQEKVLDISFAKSARGLGFVVAGGTDEPVAPNNPFLYVTEVLAGGAADMDGRLQAGDRVSVCVCVAE